MEELILSIIHFLKELSYLGLILTLSIEVIPGEVILPMAGYWVSQGEMNLTLAILAGTVGGTLGPITLYLLGKYGGRPLVLKYGKYFFIRPKDIEASERFFQKYGASVAFFGRFIPLVRTAISIPCGIAKMNIWVFSLYTFLAMLPITSCYIFLGYKLGPNWHLVAPLVKKYLIPLGIILFLLYYLLKLMMKWVNRNKIKVIRKL